MKYCGVVVDSSAMDPNGRHYCEAYLAVQCLGSGSRMLISGVRCDGFDQGSWNPPVSFPRHLIDPVTSEATTQIGGARGHMIEHSHTHGAAHIQCNMLLAWCCPTHLGCLPFVPVLDIVMAAND